MNAAIAAARLGNQRIATPITGGPAAVVAALGAVQAQEFEAAKWGLGLRMRDGTTDASIERAFTDGRILRTHVLRPTWHFVPRADIRWMLELTGPRVQRTVTSYHRRLGLDAALLTRATTVIERALGEHGPLTRGELRGHLARAGIVVEPMPLAFIMTHAELTAVVCSGPRRDRQFTYALLAARAPDARALPRDEALGTLTRRYFASHGPATVRDFVWWSGVTTSDAKRGLEIIRARQASIDGDTYWSVANRPASRSLRPRRDLTAHLLPIYDEYLVAYRDRAAVPHATLPRGSALAFQHALVIDGQVAGTWRIKDLVMTITPLRTLTARERKAARDAASRYERFLEAEISVT
jgi:DNA glycosylase AlkZ-like